MYLFQMLEKRVTPDFRAPLMRCSAALWHFNLMIDDDKVRTRSCMFTIQQPRETSHKLRLVHFSGLVVMCC